MNFAPCPPNTFPEFIETYFQRCRERVPMIEANAGKWSFEDLVPGLSDFDTRFIVRDGMTADDWCRMSTEVGHVHYGLARERKEWARTLEHLPGINLEWSELTEPDQYFPEFSKWTFYAGPEDRKQAALRAFADRPWTSAVEAYHWKIISVYYGPYNRTIDPAVNVGIFENKYPLHSRLMHYLAPAVQSAVCLMKRATSPGKLDAFRAARELFPDPNTMDLVLDLVEDHYESEYYLTEPGLTELDRRLEGYLSAAVDEVRRRGTALCIEGPVTATSIRDAANALAPPESTARLFESLRFARLMKGRLWFYAQDIPWFDSRWLILIELGRLRTNFYEFPLKLFGKAVLGIDTTPEKVLPVTGLSAEEIGALRRFSSLTGPEAREGDLKKKALEIAESYDPFLHAIERLMDLARGTRLRAPGAGMGVVS